MSRLGIRRGHPDDYDDAGNYQPGPTRHRTTRTQCQTGCCGNGPRLCETEDDDDA